MKKRRRILCLVVMMALFAPSTRAQIPIVDIIAQGIKKVIVAVDLQVQRKQNETIWLQNAQKQLENVMSKLQLEEINDWMEKQRKLYADYFDELAKVKSAIMMFQRLKDIVRDEAAIISEYKQTWMRFRLDKQFTPEELSYMERIYLGMLAETAKNVDQMELVVQAFATKMTDAERLEIIDKVEENTAKIRVDLRDFNNQNRMISIQRAIARGEIDYAKKLYGL